MNNPLVSVIVPIYNSEAFLDECIQSILNQTLKDIELILVNDASPDNSKEIMERYAKLDNRVVLIHNVINGHPNPRNAGIKAATGRYLGFVDADDWVEPTMYEKLYSATKNESIDVVVSEYDWVFPDGTITRDENIADEYFVANKKEVIRGIALHGGRLFTNIWKRDLIVSNKLFFLEHIHYSDLKVMAWYLCANNIAKVKESFYKYRVNPISVTSQKDYWGFFDRLITSKDMLDTIRALGVYEIYKEEVDYLFYRLFYLNSIIGAIKNFTKTPYEKINEIKREFFQLVKIEHNMYYKQVKWKKWSLLVRIIGFNTKLGCLLAKIAVRLFK